MVNLISITVVLASLTTPTRPEPGPPKKGEPPELTGVWAGYAGDRYRYSVIIEKVEMPLTIIYVATWYDEEGAATYVGDVSRLASKEVEWHEEYRSGGPLWSSGPWQWRWDGIDEMWKDDGKGWTLRKPK